MRKYHKQSPETIQSMFGTIAQSYDTANSFLSLGLHRYWNKKLVEKVSKKEKSAFLVDLCCGTGEIGLAWLKKQTFPSKVYFLDFCKEMLDIAKIKSDKKVSPLHSVEFLQADAQAIPLSENLVDAVTISYGIRNVAEPSRCFKEVHRILKEEGSFGILELTEPKNKMIRKGHLFYLKYLVPYIGGWISSNREAYSYLSQSIPSFAKPEELVEELHEVGFKEIRAFPLCSGIATLFYAKKS